MPYYRVLGGAHHGTLFEDDGECPPEVRLWKPVSDWPAYSSDPGNTVVALDEATDRYRCLLVRMGRWREEKILVPLDMPNAEALALWERQIKSEC